MIHLFLMFIVIQSVYNIGDADDHYSLSRDRDVNARLAYDPRNPKHLVDRNGRRRITISVEDGLDSFFNLRTKTIPGTTAAIPDNLKRRVQRTTQKQYEIINMLWRKTRIFLNDDDNNNAKKALRNQTTSMLILPGENIILSTSTVLPSTRSSNIEFYYNDEDPNHEKQCDCKETECNDNDCVKKQTTMENNKSFLIFHLKAPYAIPQLAKLNLSHEDIMERSEDVVSETIANESYKPMHSRIKETMKFPKEPFGKKTINQAVSRSLVNHSNQNNYKTNKVLQIDIESTTIYDKIKFFELYDQYTEKSGNNYIYKNHSEKLTTAIYNKNNERIQLEHVDHSSHDHDQAKLSKKHIKEKPQNTHRVRKKGKTIKSKPLINRAATVKQVENEQNVNLTKSNIDITLLSYMNGNVSWSEYPFVAVYVNEPSHVYCDAAAISPHWLIASGACLSRVSKKPLSGAQSAFVAYCGERWWRPERMAYVKYTRVHPSYNPWDKEKNHLHNIGVIQVVTSMLSACSGWAPVSMISHQSAANPTGIEASAVGWGLDRFGTRYGAADLPKIPLMIYKGIVYFGSCPGNTGYSKALRLGDANGVKYVHCLSLPPYTSETNDPVHGGLLLVGGKLIALYLQEERRPWGHQSAQYTGIWPLISWVMQVTREHQVDSFVFEV